MAHRRRRDGGRQLQPQWMGGLRGGVSGWAEAAQQKSRREVAQSVSQSVSQPPLGTAQQRTGGQWRLDGGRAGDEGRLTCHQSRSEGAAHWSDTQSELRCQSMWAPAAASLSRPHYIAVTCKGGGHASPSECHLSPRARAVSSAAVPLQRCTAVVVVQWSGRLHPPAPSTRPHHRTRQDTDNGHQHSLLSLRHPR